MLSHMSKHALFTLFVLACFGLFDSLATGQSTDTNDPCTGYRKTPLPSEALAVPAPKAWPDCASIHSYSGIGRKVDYVAARQCAWRERSAQLVDLEPRYTAESLFGGSAMLTVLFANGEGVEQSKSLALRFACEAGLSDDGMSDLLALPAEPHVTQKKFIYCDHAMTTFDMNFCAQYQDEITAQKRQDALDAFSTHWPQAEKTAFAALANASEKYIEAHGEGEVYQGGTIRALRTDGVEEHQREEFLAAVRRFESGKLPEGSDTDAKNADADLNATYKSVLALAAKQNFADDDGDIRPGGIQKAERAWLKYRDAWVAFAKVRYPKTNSSAWRTLLARNRYWNLRATMCEVGWSDRACRAMPWED